MPPMHGRGSWPVLVDPGSDADSLKGVSLLLRSFSPRLSIVSLEAMALRGLGFGGFYLVDSQPYEDEGVQSLPVFL